MRHCVVFKTRDGKLHDTEGRAKQHAEQMYGQLISKLAHKVVALDFKYTAVVHLLADSDTQLLFQEALLWQQDIELEDEVDEDDSE